MDKTGDCQLNAGIELTVEQIHDGITLPVHGFLSPLHLRAESQGQNQFIEIVWNERSHNLR